MGKGSKKPAELWLDQLRPANRIIIAPRHENAP
jgi:hypothetical protein